VNIESLESSTIPGWFGSTVPASLDTGLGSIGETPPVERAIPRILLVDDDPFMLGMQSRMLRDMGFDRLTTAGSAESALPMLADETSPVDVILCDLNMPGMDGIEFLQILSAAAFRGSVILLSGEGARIMHSVRKLFDGSPMVVLGALEKPASRAAMSALLEAWRPLPAIRLDLAEPAMRAGDMRRAQVECPWVLHFQPKVDLSSGAFVGVEALVRWNHPDLGLLYPDRFIGPAEEFGTIDSLTDWVLQAALAQLARWRRRSLRIHMAVNISMENLRAPGFAARVGELVRATCCAPHDVTLEITESRLMAQSSVPLETLVRLRMQRFGLSIDDFGTGHSSLAQLRDVPFTELKVDRGFVMGARHNQIIRPILEGSIGIAKRLGLQSVAEGVETQDDWRLLREMDCDLAQGWYVGKPMPAELIPAWLERWHSRRPEWSDKVDETS
jgi:EAL domain-containing protein (putative c-di-GMP-specific phosphodiesterase class I)/ActR/RegA family two-component response regulator